MKIKSLNTSYVFFDDETQKKTTYELLMQAKEQFQKDIEYYKRLEEDIKARKDELHKKFDSIKIIEPIKRDFRQYCQNEQLKKEQDEVLAQICVLSDFMNDTFDKRMHDERKLELIYHILPLFATK